MNVLLFQWRYVIPCWRETCGEISSCYSPAGPVCTADHSRARLPCKRRKNPARSCSSLPCRLWVDCCAADRASIRSPSPKRVRSCISGWTPFWPAKTRRWAPQVAYGILFANVGFFFPLLQDRHNFYITKKSILFKYLFYIRVYIIIYIHLSRYSHQRMTHDISSRDFQVLISSRKNVFLLTTELLRYSVPCTHLLPDVSVLSDLCARARNRRTAARGKSRYRYSPGLGSGSMLYRCPAGRRRLLPRSGDDIQREVLSSSFEESQSAILFTLKRVV